MGCYNLNRTDKQLHEEISKIEEQMIADESKWKELLKFIEANKL